MLDARLGGSLTAEWWQDVEGLALAVGVTGRRTSAAPDRCRAALAGCCVPRTEYAAVLSIVVLVATPDPPRPIAAAGSVSLATVVRVTVLVYE
jgi:hypothetical protein